jgi:hypothetical protein
LEKIMKPGLLWFFVIGSASAGLTDYVAHIESNPCSDGWAECVFDGERIEVTGQSSGGIMHNSNDRVDFWTFQPLPALSPFVSFEPFPDVVEAVEEVPEPEPVVRKDPTPKKVVSSSNNDYDAENRREQERLEAERLEAERLEAERLEAERLEAARLAKAAESQRRNEDAVCAPIEELEDAAMLGALNKSQSSCLEKELNTASSITEKRKISNILINNALSAKNWNQWERYTKRHLDKFDRSDANMCYGFSVYMFNKKRYSNAIVWAERGLEQKQRFSAGSDYKKKVYTLYKLKTMASNTLWSVSEQKMVSISDDDLREKEKAKAEKYQSKTKNFSREWLDYARSSGQSQNLPMQICVSAATKSFCQ